MQIPTWSGRFWLWIAVAALIIAAVTITACVVAMREAARRRQYERRIEAVFHGALDQLTSAIATAEGAQINRTDPEPGNLAPLKASRPTLESASRVEAWSGPASRDLAPSRTPRSVDRGRA
jgi:hypothetical protein